MRELSRMRMSRGAQLDVVDLPEMFQQGVARSSELRKLGLSSSAIGNRTQVGGPWQRLLPGVVLLANAPPTRSQLVHAVLRYAEPYALVTGFDALWLHGIRCRTRGPVHVLIPHCRQVRGAPSVLVERTKRLPAPHMKCELPVVPLARAVLDAARRLNSVARVQRLVDHVRQYGAVSLSELRAELALGSRRGSAIPRKVLTACS